MLPLRVKIELLFKLLGESKEEISSTMHEACMQTQTLSTGGHHAWVHVDTALPKALPRVGCRVKAAHSRIHPCKMARPERVRRDGTLHEGELRVPNGPSPLLAQAFAGSSRPTEVNAMPFPEEPSKVHQGFVMH
jgi:hypothetical protein